MHYLGLALYAEGPTDERFLSPLLLRLCDEICRGQARSPVEFSDVLPLTDSPRRRDARRGERIVEAARLARGAWSLLFVQADADGDAKQARGDRVQPAIDRLHEEFGDEGRAVALIPVRATEAWSICDGDALRRVLGTRLNDQALGLPPSAMAVERLADPKQALQSAFEAGQTPRRRQTRSVGSVYGPLGEQVSLERLRELPAFADFEAELVRALQTLRVLD